MNYWQNYPKFMVSLLKAVCGQGRHEGERLRLRLAAQGRRELLLDVHLRRHVPGQLDARRRQGAGPRRAHLLRHEPGRHRPELAEDGRRALEAEVARRRRERRDGDRARSGRRPKEYGGADAVEDPDRGLPAARRPSSPRRTARFTNSARWIQWKWKALDPPGQAKTDQEILARIVLAVRDLYKKEGGALPEAGPQRLVGLHEPGQPDLGEVLKEINGKALADIPDPKDKTKVLKTAGQQLDGFGQLQDDGSTIVRQLALLAASSPRPATCTQRRNNADPIGPRHVPPVGASPGPPTAASCTTAPRPTRTASPWDPTRAGIEWNGEKWVGDVPDIKPDAPPGHVRRVHHAARGRRPALRAGPQRRAVPRALRGGRGAGRQPAPPEGQRRTRSPRSSPRTRTSRRQPEEYPVVCTTYRLTEHFHYWTKHNPRLNEVQPDFFVEIPEELAKEKGIANGGDASRSRRPRLDHGDGDGDETPAPAEGGRKAASGRSASRSTGATRATRATPGRSRTS